MNDDVGTIEPGEEGVHSGESTSEVKANFRAVFFLIQEWYFSGLADRDHPPNRNRHRHQCPSRTRSAPPFRRTHSASLEFQHFCTDTSEVVCIRKIQSNFGKIPN